MSWGGTFHAEKITQIKKSRSIVLDVYEGQKVSQDSMNKVSKGRNGESGEQGARLKGL